MPRPIRCRKIEQLPVYRSFSPDDIVAEESVKITVDEFETLRLLDDEGLTQEACANRMNKQQFQFVVLGLFVNLQHKAADDPAVFPDTISHTVINAVFDCLS